MNNYDKSRHDTGGGNRVVNLNIKLYEGIGNHEMNTELFGKVAEDVAKKICPGIKSNQVRMFFEQFLVIKGKILSDDDFKRQLPYIKMIKARAAYSEGRKNITDTFKGFINQMIDLVATRRDFELICDFFECVVAYSYECLKKQ